MNAKKGNYGCGGKLGDSCTFACFRFWGKYLVVSKFYFIDLKNDNNCVLGVTVHV